MLNVVARNNVQIVGEGNSVMIFAHGFGCDQNTWRYIKEEFAKDFKLVLFDFVGAGRSDLSAYDAKKYNKLDGYAQDLIEICESLHIKDSVFIGHSVGCMVGVLAAIAKPLYFKKLVFVSPSPRYLNDVNYYGGMESTDLNELLEVMDSNYLGWSAAMAPAIMGTANNPELGEELTASFCATDPEIAKNFAKVTFLSDNRDDLGKLKVPSLTIQCRQDMLAPEEVGQYIQDNTPQNTMVVIGATGHCPHLSAPVEVISSIKTFLN
jgi:sigma-B regulation protein RsbQ